MMGLLFTDVNEPALWMESHEIPLPYYVWSCQSDDHFFIISGLKLWSLSAASSVDILFSPTKGMHKIIH